MGREPIVVVGAGPTGALLGIELARRGADVRVIEKAPLPPGESRAGGVQSRTLELLARLGIADELIAAGNRIRAMNYYSDGKRIFQARYGYLDGPFPFMLHVPQYETQRVLDACLGRLGVPVERGVELARLEQQEEGVTLQTTTAGGATEGLTAAWVVGCDGAHSTVRHQLQMPFEGSPYEWEWMGADLEVDWGFSESEVHLFTSPAGVLACLPFGAGRWRLLTPRVGEGSGERFRPSLDAMREVVGRRGPAGMSIDNPSWLGSFRASRRSAPSYRQGRVFLAGDAVHIHSPAAGQGMNTGLGDAANLGWKLGLVATGRAPAALLDTYQAERAPVAKGVIALTHMVMKAFDSTTPCKGLRDRLFAYAGATATLQRRFTRRLAQHSVTYRNGPLASAAGDGPGRRQVKAGDRAPDVSGLLRDGSPTSLFDLIARPEFTLFALEADCRAMCRELAPFAASVAVFSVGAGSGAGSVTDPNGLIRRRYGLRPGEVCAIRPDGYVAYLGRPQGLAGWFSRHLPPPSKSAAENRPAAVYG